MGAASQPTPEMQRRAARRMALLLGVFALALFSATLWSMAHAR